ncbi:MAG: hypothetical protein JXB03_09195 [Spirochaetales bacterium]|nr:hypothetical protein [Spirochaetales bacterium]
MKVVKRIVLFFAAVLIFSCSIQLGLPDDDSGSTSWEPDSEIDYSLLPSGSAGDWTSAGVEGGIPDYPFSVDVRGYGAVGDGSADDTAAIQAAMAACVPGQAVYFPQGSYRTTSTLRITASIVLRGEGPELSHIISNHSGAAVLILSDYAGIEDVHVHTEGQTFVGYSGEKITFTDVSNSWVRNIETSGYTGMHVLLNGTTHCEVRDSYLHNSLEDTSIWFDDGEYFSSYGIHINGGGASYNLVENNIVDWFRHNMLIQEFDNTDMLHNVFAYNFCWYTFTHSDTSPYSSTTSMEFHNGAVQFSLVEGNVYEQGGFQGSGNHQKNSIFRNRINNGGQGTGSASSHIYVIGNEFTEIKHPDSSSARYGNTAQDIDASESDIGHGNYSINPSRGIEWDPAIANHRIPASWYLHERPEWFGDLDWPCYGGDLMEATSGNNMRRNPAEVRYWSMLFPENVPSDLQISAAGNDITLSWNHSPYQAGSGVDYIIVRSRDNENFHRVGETSITTFHDSNLDPGSYHYYVRARNNYGGIDGSGPGGESSASDTVTVTLP